MTERRYRDGEVRKILESATRADATGARPSGVTDGLTLAEIQSIAHEVGVPADAVARAAAALDATGARRPRTSLGMPIEVGRTIQLPRELTDQEWDRLVAELRVVFRARGKVAVQGGLREWWNGNLHASVEPAENGYRLRLGTIKGDAMGTNALAATGIGLGAVVMAVTAFAGGAPEVAGPLMLGLSGTGMLFANLVRLPRWARERERQMADVAARITRIMSETTGEDVER